MLVHNINTHTLQDGTNLLRQLGKFSLSNYKSLIIQRDWVSFASVSKRRRLSHVHGTATIQNATYSK